MCPSPATLTMTATAHSNPEQGIDACQSLSCNQHLLCFRTLPVVGRKVAVGKNGGQQQHDRSRNHKGLGRTCLKFPSVSGSRRSPARGHAGFVREENAELLLRRGGAGRWTTDKDGIIAALLAAGDDGHSETDPGEIYHDLRANTATPFTTGPTRTPQLSEKGDVGDDKQRKRPSPTLRGRR